MRKTIKQFAVIFIALFSILIINIGIAEADSCCYDYPRGDANGDGKANILDITTIIRYLYQHGPSPACLAAADINCDCVVDIRDITVVILYLYHGGQAPCSCETWEDNCDTRK